MSHSIQRTLTLAGLLTVSIFAAFAGRASVASESWAGREDRSAKPSFDLGLTGGLAPSEMKPKWQLSPEVAPPKHQVQRGPASEGGGPGWRWPRQFVHGQEGEPDPSRQPVSDSFKHRMGY